MAGVYQTFLIDLQWQKFCIFVIRCTPQPSISPRRNQLIWAICSEMVDEIHVVTRWRKKDKMLTVLSFLSIFLWIYTTPNESFIWWFLAYTLRHMTEKLVSQTIKLSCWEVDFINVTRWWHCNAMTLVFGISFFPIFSCSVWIVVSIEVDSFPSSQSKRSEIFHLLTALT